MIFTIQDLERIKKYMVSTGIRDCDLPPGEEDIPEDAEIKVVTRGNKEFKVLRNSDKSNTFVENNPEAVVNIITEHADDSDSEDLVLVHANGDTTTIDSGLKNDEIDNLLN